MRRTEEEIIRSGETIVGDVYIGTGETDVMRLLAQAAKKLQETHPDIHYHITSGNAEHVLEYLDKGLIDFGLLFSQVDSQKYEAIPVPVKVNMGRTDAQGFSFGTKRKHFPRGFVGQAFDYFPSKRR